ncbi:hypothetical protein [Phytohabitans kaempferiae]|uniref:Uncharacterized protein n=1 Tax=Phytohabitans kaempferiae TaxID=1620943 RepID=A0ABV6MG11_9ACTN
MASEEERAAEIAAVIDALTALGNRPPGSRLRSDDWNALVDAVGRVARLPAIGTGGDAAASGELPPGSVGFEELGVDVQQLLRSGPFADPRQLSAQRELDRRLGALGDRLGAVETRIDALLSTVNRAETGLSRQGNDLRLVDQRVAGALGLKGEVGDLRTLLGSVRTDVADVLALRDEIGGIDLPGLRDRVTELSGFRDAWRDAQGNVVTFAAFSRRIAEAEDRAIDDEELRVILDSRFRDVVVDTGPIRTAVTNDLRVEVVAAKEELRADQQRRFNEALSALRADVESEIDRAVGTSIGQLTEKLGELAGKVLDERLVRFREELREELIRIIDERLDKRPKGLLADDLLALEARLLARVDELDRSAATRADLSTLDTAIRADLGRRHDELAARVDGTQRGQAELASTLRRERADAAAQDNRRHESLLDQAIRREGIERAGAIDAAAQRVAGELRGELDATARALRAERDAAVTAAIQARTASIGSELESRLRVVAMDAVAAVEADVNALQGALRGVDARLGDLDRRVGAPVRPGQQVLDPGRPFLGSGGGG